VESAFLLFTTLRAMRLAHELLREEFRRHALEFPLMLQGEGSRSELLERFRRLGNAVLLGSASFWEGVDVRGDALSLVVIDKLPFCATDDPCSRRGSIRWRAKAAIPSSGTNYPRRSFPLKQGAGRLIRDENRPGRARHLRS